MTIPVHVKFTRSPTARIGARPDAIRGRSGGDVPASAARPCTRPACEPFSRYRHSSLTRKGARCIVLEFPASLAVPCWRFSLRRFDCMRVRLPWSCCTTHIVAGFAGTALCRPWKSTDPSAACGPTTRSPTKCRWRSPMVTSSFGDAHSHGDLPPQPSHVDHGDETHKDGLHVIVGGLGRQATSPSTTSTSLWTASVLR